MNSIITAVNLSTPPLWNYTLLILQQSQQVTVFIFSVQIYSNPITWNLLLPNLMQNTGPAYTGGVYCIVTYSISCSHGKCFISDTIGSFPCDQCRLVLEIQQTASKSSFLGSKIRGLDTACCAVLCPSPVRKDDMLFFFNMWVFDSLSECL